MKHSDNIKGIFLGDSPELVWWQEPIELSAHIYNSDGELVARYTLAEDYKDWYNATGKYYNLVRFYPADELGEHVGGDYQTVEEAQQVALADARSLGFLKDGESLVLASGN